MVRRCLRIRTRRMMRDLLISASATRPRSDNTQYQASLRADYDVSSDMTVTSITSFVRYDRDENVEFGGVSLNTPTGTDQGDEELTLDFAKVTGCSFRSCGSRTVARTRCTGSWGSTTITQGV